MDVSQMITLWEKKRGGGEEGGEGGLIHAYAVNKLMIKKKKVGGVGV